MAYGFTEEWLAEQQAKAAARRQAPTGPRLRLVADGSNCPNDQEQEATRGSPEEKPRTLSATKERPEEALQIQAVEYLELALPAPFRFWHTPNQRGTRSRWENMLLKAMGVKAGVGDILIAGGRPPLIWLELKSPTGRLSDPQKDWRDWCALVGIPWFLCRSLEDVVEALESLQIRLKVRLHGV